MNVFAVYAPNFNAVAAEKDAFYDKLRELLGTVRSGEEVLGSATVNAGVAIGWFGLGHLNDNGKGLLRLCEGSPTGLLNVAGTFFFSISVMVRCMRRPSISIILIMSWCQCALCVLL